MIKLWTLVAVMSFSVGVNIIYGISTNFSGTIMAYLIALSFIIFAFVVGIASLPKNPFDLSVSADEEYQNMPITK